VEVRRWLWLPPEQPLVRKAEMGGRAITKDDMVEHSNAQQLPGVDQPLGYGAILAARCWVP